MLRIGAALIVLLTAPAVWGQFIFTETVYPVPGTPSAVATGDFNGDNASDLAIALSSTNQVQILYGGGAGLLTGPVVGVGTHPIDIVVTDFNNDGHADFATADDDSLQGSLVGMATISIQLGDGLGGFTAAPQISAFICQAIATGDFNADGNADLAVHRDAGHPGANDSIWLYLGDGLGNFSVNGQYSLGINIWDIHATHLNNDSHLDLVATCTGVNTTSSSFAGIFTVIGDGTGGFTSFPMNPLANEPMMKSALGDFDGDGNLDLVGNRIGATSCQDTVAIVSGDGAGGFSLSSSLALPCGEHAFAVADWNNDGYDDIAVARQADPTSPTLIGTVTLALSDTIGGYTFLDVAASQEPAALWSEDLDGDTLPDLVIASHASSQVSVLLTGGGTGDDAFLRGDSSANGSVGIEDAITTLSYLFVPGTAIPTCLDAADFNDDGSVLINDPVATLNYLFTSGNAPIPPFPMCGFDVTTSSLPDCVYPLALCP